MLWHSELGAQELIRANLASLPPPPWCPYTLFLLEQITLQMMVVRSVAVPDPRLGNVAEKGDRHKI